MKRRIAFCALELALLLVGATGCQGKTLAKQALGKASEAVEELHDEHGDVIMSALDRLRNAEYHGGPFENNLDSARTYLLEQMQEKYGMEFVIVGNEKLKNYGPFSGATYTCKVAPAEAPEQTTTALVSQSMYRDVRDSYAVYFFKDEAEAPVLELCETKDYVLDQRISLEMPGTDRLWAENDGLEKFLSESGAYVKLVLRLEDDLDVETYAEQILDFLGSVHQLDCNLLLQARANQTYIFHSEIKVLGGFDAELYTLDKIKKEIEIFLSMGTPQ